jgi:hypothetical protein
MGSGHDGRQTMSGPSFLERREAGAGPSSAAANDEPLATKSHGLFLLGLAVHVASVGDASTEELSPLTRDRRIAGLIRRELFVPKHLALLCHFLRNGPVRLGNSRQQRSSRQEKNKSSASNPPIIAHSQTPHALCKKPIAA